MSDEHLRELERQWKETGSAVDEAAYLLGRMRADEIDRKALELAAYLGHEAARVALGDSYSWGNDTVSSEADLSQWVNGLENYSSDRQLFSRSAVAAVRRVLPIFDEVSSGVVRIRSLMEVTEEWILGSSTDMSQHLEAVGELLSNFGYALAGVTPGSLPLERDSDLSPSEVLDHDACLIYFHYHLARAAHRAAIEVDPKTTLLEVRHGLQAIQSANQAAKSSRADDSASFIQQAISEELIPWVLGTGDPVLDRVRERERSGRQGEVRDDVEGVLEDE